MACRRFMPAVCVALLAAFVSISAAHADYLWVGKSQHWGKVISLTNEHVEFQINCSGNPQKFKWKKGSFSLTFSEGCGPVDIGQWGEPVNCRKRGRVFVIGNENASDYYDFVSFENDTLTIGGKTQKTEVKTPRKDQIAIWVGCE